jgi:hypothetical protein
MKCEVCNYRKATCYIGGNYVCSECRDKEKNKDKIKRRGSYIDFLAKKYSNKK